MASTDLDPSRPPRHERGDLDLLDLDAEQLTDAEGAHAMSATHLGDLCVYAVRYALGRTSGAPSDVAAAVREAWPAITDDARATILRDLRGSVAEDDWQRRRGTTILSLPLGHDCDRETWTTLLRDLETP